MLGEIHRQFIGAVREGRGERLPQSPDLFSGWVWTGEKSVELGLIDGLADIRQVAKDEIKAEKIVDYTKRRKVLERLLSGAEAVLSQSAAAFGPAAPVLR
jgi:protease-4